MKAITSCGPFDLYRVDLENSAVTWHHAEPLLQKSVAYATSGLDTDKMWDMMVAGNAHIFLAYHREAYRGSGAVLVTTGTTNHGRIINIDACGGDNDWKEYWVFFLQEIEQWFAKQTDGILDSRIIGRPGWWRAGKKAGYEPTHFFAEKRVKG